MNPNQVLKEKKSSLAGNRRVFQNSNFMMPDSPILKRNIKLGFTSIEDITNLHTGGGKSSNLRGSGQLMQKNGIHASSKNTNKSPLKNNSYYKPDQMSSSYMRHG